MSAHLDAINHRRAKQPKPAVKRVARSRIADLILAAAATEAIDTLTTVPHEGLKITARNGWLCLEGSVNWRHQRATVEDVARGVPGVQGVNDAITINSVSFFDEPTPWRQE